MLQTICQQISAKPPLKKAAPKGRIKSEWIAELFLKRFMIIIPSSTAEELIAGLYLPVPAWLGLPD
jgi:hypothetical protein